MFVPISDVRKIKEKTQSQGGRPHESSRSGIWKKQRLLRWLGNEVASNHKKKNECSNDNDLLGTPRQLSS
jgi:hypothetical protein